MVLQSGLCSFYVKTYVYVYVNKGIFFQWSSAFEVFLHFGPCHVCVCIYVQRY